MKNATKPNVEKASKLASKKATGPNMEKVNEATAEKATEVVEANLPYLLLVLSLFFLALWPLQLVLF